MPPFKIMIHKSKDDYVSLKLNMIKFNRKEVGSSSRKFDLDVLVS